PRFAAKACLILSPLCPILMFQLFTAKTWSDAAESSQAIVPATPVAAAGSARPPIFIFVFDEWSVKRTKVGADFLPEYPNMRRFSRQALDFTNAWSFSSRSFHSVPAILYQRDERIETGQGQTYWHQ